MAVLSNTGIRAGAAGAGGAEAYTVKRSARFNNAHNSDLQKTFSSAGNRKTFTHSFWVKRSSAGSQRTIFSGNTSGSFSAGFQICFENADTFSCNGASPAFNLTTTRLFRDQSAWYHMVVSIDTTQATASNRVKIYINGEQVTAFNLETYPSQNDDLNCGDTVFHQIGGLGYVSSVDFDGYLADMHFVDGFAKTPGDFAETNEDTGQWVPKKYSGSYGTNGFHLAMDPAKTGTTYSNQLSMTNATGWHADPYGKDAGFNGIIGSGTGGYVQVTGGSNPNSITFTPSSGIAYSSTVEVYIINAANQVSVNGGTLQSISADTWVTVASGSGTLTSLKFERASTSGASFSGIRIDGKDLLDTTAIGYDSSGSRNDWVDNNLAASVRGYTPSVLFDSNDYLSLADSDDFNLVSSGTGDFTIEMYVYSTSSSNQYVLSSGTDATRLYINTGSGRIHLNNPDDSFLMESSAAYGAWGTNKWVHLAFCKSSSTGYIFVDGVSYPAHSGSFTLGGSLDFNAFQIGRSSTSFIGYISNVRVVKGTAQYTANFTPPTTPLTSVTNTKLLCCQSSSDVTVGAVKPGAITANGDPSALLVEGDAGDLDVLADTPGAPYDNSLNGGGNYCTLNPLNNNGLTLSNGNLTAYKNSASSWTGVTATFGMNSGKWYWEHVFDTQSTSYVGLTKAGWDKTYVGSDANSWGYYPVDGKLWTGASGSSYGASWTGGDVIGVAFDADNGTLIFYKNGSSQGTAATGLTSGPYFPGISMIGTITCNINFGQRTFAYTPPAGYKALNTYSLPDPTIPKGNVGFEALAYNGTGSAQSISTVCSPDLVWLKPRSVVGNHQLLDVIRGTGYRLFMNTTSGNDTDNSVVTAFGTDSFTLGTGGAGNQSGETFVGWVWEAGDSNTSVSADSSKNYASGIDTNHAPLLFDGDLTTFYAPDGSTHTWTAPSAITVSTKLEIWYKSSVASRDFEVNDNGTTINTGTSASGKWVDLSFTGSLTKIVGTNGWQTAAIRVDGNILVGENIIASTYRSNPATGFSIVSYSGSGSGSANTDSGDAFKHGLNAAPKFVICKKTSAANSWVTYHAETALGALTMDGTGALDTSSYLFAKKHPTSDVVFLGNNPEINGTGSNYISYCWSEVAGYSKFGTYTGNGNDDGPFIWCGFRPAFTIVIRTDAGQNRALHDIARDPYNAVSNNLCTNNGEEENDPGTMGGPPTNARDFLANGFKLRKSTAVQNASGGTYVFAAWAESPFKYSNAR